MVQALRTVLLLVGLSASEGFSLRPPNLRVSAVRSSRSAVMLAEEAAGLQAQLKERMKRAMKKGPDGKAELGAVRMMLAALTTKQKEDGVDSLPDDVVVTVLTKV